MLNSGAKTKRKGKGAFYTFVVFTVCLFASLIFVGCDNLNLPKLSAPTNVSIENGVVRFERAKNDEYYVFSFNNETITVFPNAKPYVELYSINGVDYLEYNANRLLSVNDSISLKIKTCAKDWKDSDWTTPYSYTHIAKMSTPTNLSSSGSVLTWTPVRNAGLYVVKVITPNDNVEFDDPESVKNNENLTKYQFNTNRFDFTTLLTSAGVYKFYVSSVSIDNSYLESDYSNKYEYEHMIQLNTPSATKVHRVKGADGSQEFHMTAVLDHRANAVKIQVENVEEIVEVTDSNITHNTSANNLVDINLTKIFEKKNLQFNEIREYSFKIQSMYRSTEKSYYLNSNYSAISSCANTAILETPTVTLSYSEDNMAYVATWSTTNNANITGYRVWTFADNSYKSLLVDSNVHSIVLEEGFSGVAVQTLGSGGYLSSKVSDVKSVSSEEQDIMFDARCIASSLVWTSVENATFLVEAGNTVVATTQSQLNLLSLQEKVNKVKITVMKKGYVPLVKDIDITYSLKLPAPYISGSGFDSMNPYLLSFNPVNNAIGYRLYISTSNEEPVAVPKLFTQTSIDIGQYLISSNDIEYYVYIQAVADPLSMYDDSSLSSKLHVSHARTLDRPTLLADNGQIVFKTNEAGNDKYTLRFNGVQSANSYEILVNFNRITVLNDGRTQYYEVDITRYLTSANIYSIMIRALPLDSEQYIKPSGFSTYEYILRQQLAEVDGIRVAENNGRYTISFSLQDNAGSYRLRIVKLNDNTYLDYLLQLGLSNVLVVQGATDITEYVEKGGEYRIYVTALARPNSYYADSNESKEYGEISKLTSLNLPTDIQYSNVSKTEFLVRWTGDENADYYIVRVTNPTNKAKEYTVLNGEVQNIADFIDIEGDYKISVKAMIDKNSTNSQLYTSSAYCEPCVITYIYEQPFDFERAEVYYNGATYNLSINNISDLTNVLWYHYLFGVDENYGLELYLPVEKFTSTRTAIVKLKDEAQSKLLYNFNNDEVWLRLVSSSTEAQLFAHLCRRLLEVYPEMAVLSSNAGDGEVQVTSKNLENGVKFNVKYYNALDYNSNGEYRPKQNTGSDYIEISKDYANDFDYVDQYSRRSIYSTFEIDNCQPMEVETSEQLLMAVQYGRRPIFNKPNTEAEKIYNNAKLVLTAIIGKNYTDLEKVDAIFTWLEYAYNINYDATKIWANNEKIEGSVADYGVRKEFYLEGIFLDITDSTRSGYDGEFYLGVKNATDESLSKAFTLLCGIEGIKSRKVNGSVSYSNQIKNHTWNKVYLYLPIENSIESWAWYNVDISYSDNRFVYNTINNNAQSYNMASHLYYLVSDNYLFNNVDFGEIAPIPVTFEENINVVLTDSEVIGAINQSYNYYNHSTFGMTYKDITNTLNILSIGSGITDFRYLKEYVYDEGNRYYQRYASTSGYSELQSFVLNACIMAKYYLLNNEADTASFEFRIAGKYLTGGDLTGQNSITTIINDGLTLYWRTSEPNGFSSSVKRVYDKASNETTFVLTLEWR